MSEFYRPNALVMRGGKPCSVGYGDADTSLENAAEIIQKWRTEEDVIAAWIEARDRNFDLLGYPFFACYVDEKGNERVFDTGAKSIYIPGVTVRYGETL